MAQFSDEYGQYSTSGQQGQQSGLDIENQSEQPQWNQDWTQASGYNVPSGGWTTESSVPQYSVPSQPGYDNNPQFQQGKNYR